MKYVLVLTALLLTSTSLQAAPLNVAMNCPEWQKSRQQDSYQSALSWLQGYVAAYNEYAYAGSDPEGVLGTTDSEAVANWMDNYCQQNTSSNPREAIAALIDERKHEKKACPIRRQSGRPCIPAEEEEKPEINE